MSAAVPAGMLPTVSAVEGVTTGSRPPALAGVGCPGRKSMAIESTHASLLAHVPFAVPRVHGSMQRARFTSAQRNATDLITRFLVVCLRISILRFPSCWTPDIHVCELLQRGVGNGVCGDMNPVCVPFMMRSKCGTLIVRPLLSLSRAGSATVNARGLCTRSWKESRAPNAFKHIEENKIEPTPMIDLYARQEPQDKPPIGCALDRTSARVRTKGMLRARQGSWTTVVMERYSDSCPANYSCTRPTPTVATSCLQASGCVSCSLERSLAG